MNYAKINKCDIANGTGVRVSLFVSGCTHHCKGCFNQEAQDFNYGKPFMQPEWEYIIQALKPNYITGLTVLGGEPFEWSNQVALLPFLTKVKELYPDKTIWCYTGYDFEKDLISPSKVHLQITPKILNLIDVLVDGEFIEEQKDITLKFKGSSNQRIIDVKKSLESGEAVIYE